MSHGKATVSSQTPPSQAPINTIACHPSTPGLILAASASNLAIWDLTTPSPSAPSISFSLAEPKGIWSAAWSPDGRQIAAIGKSGTLYLFTPRESTEPTASRSLPLQPLKPAKVSWVGQDIIVTSTSRTRNREYHLFSGSADKKLATVFTATLGTSTMPLLSVIDQERKIIYLASRGDMALRQVELGGTTEYQETLHPLPSLLSAQGLALAHPSTLDVMQAQIAAVLLPVTDKDGEALMPLGIKVPRRQLIDYHADLFPDVAGVGRSFRTDASSR